MQATRHLDSHDEHSQQLEPRPDPPQEALSRRDLLWGTLLASTGISVACRSLQPSPDQIATIEMYALAGEWIDEILTANPSAPGYDHLMAWMRREYPSDLSEQEDNLLFAELFLEGARMGTSRPVSAFESPRSDRGAIPPISRNQMEHVLLNPIDPARLPTNFFRDRLGRATELAANDASVRARYDEIADFQDSPLFKKKKGGNGKKCGWFCKAWKTVVVVALLVAAAAFCLSVEECKEQIVP